jgi:hypothetical protein
MTQRTNPRWLIFHIGRLVSSLVMGIVFLFMPINSHADVVSPEYFGLHIHRADSGTAWPKVPFGSFRLWDAYVQWTHLQITRRTWNFAKLDRLVALAEITKVSLLLPLGLSPSWASARPNERSAYGEGRAAEPASVEDWRIYVRTIAQRYKGRINTYEIWNEPNDKAFFSGTTAKLVELTCEAYRTLKEIDPAIVVVSPAYTGEQNIGKLEEFLAQGGGKCIDVVAYHLYVPLNSPEAIPPLVERIRQAMKRQALGHLPLWNTESGWIIENSDGTPEGKAPDTWLRVGVEQSAAFVARSYLLGSASGLDRFYWYAWDDEAMGLVEPTAKSLKPGGVALGVVAKWMIGGPRPICTETKRIWLCTLSAKSDERRVVVWSPDSSRQYTVPSGWRIQQIERADSRIGPPPPSNNIRIDELPCLLVLVPDKQT